jgi:hypothetical protein
MKFLLTAFLAAVSYCGFSQEYLILDVGTNKNIGGSLLVKKKKSYSGFGVSFFSNEFRKGRKFYDGSPAEIKSTELFKDGTLFGVYGREFLGFICDVKLGFGSRKWYSIGVTNGTEWYSYRDGGSYLLYGGNIRKEISPLVVGLGYDNFSGLTMLLGFRL